MEVSEFDKLNDLVEFAAQSDAASSIGRTKHQIIELHKSGFYQRASAAGVQGMQLEQIKSACDYMIFLHIDQEQRDDGLPYVCHPLEVATVCIDTLQITDTDILIAALLHDSLEDQIDKIVANHDTEGLTEEERFDLARRVLALRWGENVSDIITYLTNPNYTQIALVLQSEGDSRALQEIKHELYYRHAIGLIEHPQAFAIKMSDFQSNALSVFALPESLQKQKLISKYTPVIITLLEMLNSKSLIDSNIQRIVEVMRPSFENYLKLYQATLN